jgi:hypothetical protein
VAPLTGLLLGPGGEVRFPPFFEFLGGPTCHDSDAFAAGPAAWVDHGFAVVRVNYRGSTGYGREWTDALKHRVGLIELEDITAVREWCVDNGLADPERLVLTATADSHEVVVEEATPQGRLPVGKVVNVCVGDLSSELLLPRAANADWRWHTAKRRIVAAAGLARLTARRREASR